MISSPCSGGILRTFYPNHIRYIHPSSKCACLSFSEPSGSRLGRELYRLVGESEVCLVEWFTESIVTLVPCTVEPLSVVK